MLTAAMVICAAVLAASVIMSGSGIMQAAGFTYPHADKYTAGDAEIDGTVKNLDIEWVNGKVEFEYSNGKAIELHERSDKTISPDMQMRWWLDGDTLRVRYAKAGFRLKGNQQKELTVRLPESIAFGDVNISATSGELNIPALRAENLDLGVTSGNIVAAADADKISAGATSGDIDLRITEDTKEISVGTTSGSIVIEATEADRVKVSSTSGRICAVASRVTEFDAGTTSGNIDAEIGRSEKVKLGGTSGSISVKLTEMGRLEIATTSGNVSAALPEKPGFTARLETVSGAIQNSLPLTRQGNSYVCGDGSGTADIGTTSGDIRVSAVKD